jgi:hypothetical protein
MHAILPAIEDDSPMTVAPRPIPLRPDPNARTRQGADAFVRAATALCITVNEKRGDVDVTIRRLYPGEEGRAASLVTRAASTPAVLASNSLAATATADFISTLGPMSAGAQFLQRGLALTFDGAGAILVPGIVASAAQATFVKEGDSIPVRQFSTLGLTLSPRKFAVITTFTRDVFEHSLPNIEAIVGATLREAVGAALDSALLDARNLTIREV